jgi:hypothetical protein
VAAIAAAKAGWTHSTIRRFLTSSFLGARDCVEWQLGCHTRHSWLTANQNSLC